MGSFTVLHKVVVGNWLLIKMRLKIKKAPARFGAQARSSPPWPCTPPAAAIAVRAMLRGYPSPPPSTLSNDLKLGRAGGIAARDVEFELYVRGERGPLLLCWN